MNASPPRDTLTPPGDRPVRVRRVWLARVGDLVIGRVSTLILTTLALALALATFAILTRSPDPSLRPGLAIGLGLANLSLLLLLCAVVAVRLTRIWVERRRGSAGSQLHVRLVMLFSGVAVAPTILVACFSVALFHFVIERSFNDPVRTALNESLQVARGYLEEHRNNIRAVALEMASGLGRAGRLFPGDDSEFEAVIDTLMTLRGLTEVVIYDPATNQIVRSDGFFGEGGPVAPPVTVTRQAMNADVVVANSADGTLVRAVVHLDSTPPMMLVVGRPIDPTILGYLQKAGEGSEIYRQLDKNTAWLQIAFAWIYAIVALLVLLAAGLIGLRMATQIARPVGSLIDAAERVRSGDLTVRVAQPATGGELAGLSRAFNRMTGQLAAQRTELMDAYSQIDERRRFTETVLSGVSAGVIGLDAAGRVELPNRAAGEFLGMDLLAAIGHPLAEVIPEFAALLHTVEAAPERARTDEVQIGPPTRRRTLLVRIGAELSAGRTDGYVVTFDDITELQSAQRKAAWADVARRIAHEIKNPLTPIQLSAERLKRRFTKEIQSDPDTFAQCADTIIRHVGDIGRMVDEFSAFARMPQPVMKQEDLGMIAREALVLQKTARPQITWTTHIPERGPMASCDRRMIRQALTNLLQNAADAVAMREGASHIDLTVAATDRDVRLTIDDDGIGLPKDDRERLTEPYVTHKPKGTGLGLAIVKKIMEDHGGSLTLDDNPSGPGATTCLVLPITLSAASTARNEASHGA
jgi:two-component system, NtrC family, nitrogen regulation sensor histidine kinase NtrY